MIAATRSRLQPGRGKFGAAGFGLARSAGRLIWEGMAWTGTSITGTDSGEAAPRAVARALWLGLGSLLLLVLGACSMDIDPMDLRSMKRSWTPNDALACPPGICAAKADFEVPIYPLEPAALSALIDRVVAGEPRTELVAESAAIDQLTYVQRSETLGLPDVIRVQVVAVQGGASAILHSRSRYGLWDFGVNKKRLQRWLKDLEAAVAADHPPQPPAETE